MTIHDCGFKAGYTGWDHLMHQRGLKECIGEQFRTVRDIGRRLRKIARETEDRRVAGAPIWVELDGGRKVTV